jgi:hypothetical protein
MSELRGLVGLLVILAVAFLASNHRSRSRSARSADWRRSAAARSRNWG